MTQLNNNNVDHQQRLHAQFSASGSARWINCPASVKLCEQYENKSNVFADEGTKAHELADTILRTNAKPEDVIKDNIEMLNNVTVYVDYVKSLQTNNTVTYLESRVDFSNIAPEGFGTLDYAVYDFEAQILHVVDLKYGKGIKVDVDNNTQLMLYALGFINTHDYLDVKIVRLHIVQPRIDNIAYSDVTIEELTTFGEHANMQAMLALSDNPPLVAGEKQCKWCLHKHNCKALYNEVVTTIECIDITNTTDEEKRAILDKKDLIADYIKSVEGYVHNQLMAGIPFEGYKLVYGRSNRVWTDAAEAKLVELLGQDAYIKKLITITDATKKTNIKLLADVIEKPTGKLTLVTEDDKREAVLF